MINWIAKAKIINRDNNPYSSKNQLKKIEEKAIQKYKECNNE